MSTTSRITSGEELNRRKGDGGTPSGYSRDEAGGQLAGPELRMLHQRRQKIDVVADPVQLERVERLHLQVRGRIARRRLGDELGDHGVVEDRDLAAFGDAVVHADSPSLRSPASRNQW